MRISFTTRGDFSNTDRFLKKMSRRDKFREVEKYARKGVDALKAATPYETGQTAASWDYEITRSRGLLSITWTNSYQPNGAPIAIMLQYGHGTGTGGYVQGRDYINPAIRPIFDQIADGVWKVVTSA